MIEKKQGCQAKLDSLVWITEIFPSAVGGRGKAGMNMKNIFLAAWLAMNGFTFCLYGVDKRRAKRGAWRIPEKTLLLCTWLLGGVGALIGMRVFHHKTKHRLFTISAPIAAAISIVAALCGLMM